VLSSRVSPRFQPPPHAAFSTHSSLCFQQLPHSFFCASIESTTCALFSALLHPKNRVNPNVLMGLRTLCEKQEGYRGNNSTARRTCGKRSSGSVAQASIAPDRPCRSSRARASRTSQARRSMSSNSYGSIRAPARATSVRTVAFRCNVLQPAAFSVQISAICCSGLSTVLLLITLTTFVSR
jgi:hypothetical protein